ncbi:daptide biosynthesis intramembrane metalloprotease [Williamsia herbipolensis]|uniref:daptide biosynthesis intramembrane metalloprotease n=1 Tax=Williamsia herbipolensis TaxID=1603258 RepID=UPI000A8BB891|nr:daptide biosynthesis intramembrane metalloprotease [Williamsia herbipolensis]
MAAVDERLRAPELADNVRMREMPDSQPIRWVISAGTDRYFRVGADLAELARALDGTRGVDDLCATLGDRWDRDRVLGGLGVLETMQVLTDDDGASPPTRQSRIRFIPPLTVQISLIGTAVHRILPGPSTRRMGTAARRLSAVTAAVIAAVAVGCFATLVPTTIDALATTIDLRVLATVIAVSLVATAVHEYMHAWALSRYGGRVNRMGVMLFYLVPAFFCDISDAWTLDSRRRRVVVALAGGSVQAVVFAATAIAGVCARQGGAGDDVVATLALVSATSIVMVVVNLVPFVKLDGYIALMSATDIPNLRDKSLAAFADRVRAVLFGTHAPAPLRRWLPWFGGACTLVPVLLVYLAVSNWSGALAATGAVGDTIVMLLTCYLLLIVVAVIRRTVARARADGAGLMRTVVVGVLGAAVVVGVLGGVDVTRTASVSYLRTGDTTLLVSTDRATLARIGADREVTLLTNGVVLHHHVGRAETGAGVESARFPLSAVLPTRSPDLITPGYAVVVEASLDPSAPSSGLARVEVGRTSLGRDLVGRYLWPASMRGGATDLWRWMTR